MSHLFAKRLRELRKAHDMNQRDLEEALSLRPGTVSQYERGLREPGFDLLVAVADLFDASADYLLGRPEAPRYSYAVLEARRRLGEALAAAGGVTGLTQLFGLAHQAGPEVFAPTRLARRASVPPAALRLCAQGLKPLAHPALERLASYMGVDAEALSVHNSPAPLVDTPDRLSHG